MKLLQVTQLKLVFLHFNLGLGHSRPFEVRALSTQSDADLILVSSKVELEKYI